MTVAELIAALSGYAPNTEVRLVQHPRWPFEYSVRRVVARSELDASDASDATDAADTDGRADAVFIVEGAQLAYGRRDAFDR